MSELGRKSIHIFASVLPLAYYFYFTREQFILICIVLSLLFLTAEAGRIFVPQLKRIYEIYFAPLLRHEELKSRLNGATWMVLGITATVLVFDKYIAVPAILLATVSDALAALIGKKWGRARLAGKSVEGFLAFLISGTIIVWLSHFNWPIAFATAFGAALAELLPMPLNDNITVPLTGGIILVFFNG